MDDRPTELYFYSGGLTGTMPTEIFDLTDLNRLWMPYNSRLTGTIPPQIGKTSLISSLNLMSTGISGTLPTQLGLLTDLESFNVGQTWKGISGTIPSQFSLLSKLSTLSLSRTSGNSNQGLSGTLPALSGFGKLVVLKVEEDPISGTIPPSL